MINIWIYNTGLDFFGNPDLILLSKIHNNKPPKVSCKWQLVESRQLNLITCDEDILTQSKEIQHKYEGMI